MGIRPADTALGPDGLASAASQPPPPDKSGHTTAGDDDRNPAGGSDQAAAPEPRPATARAPKASGVRRG
jgi:hypothetical protein